jgi:hypothetical protein
MEPLKMLQIVDQPNKYSIMRIAPDATGAMKRARIGVVPKATMEVPTELQSVLTPDEAKELGSYIAVLQSSAVLKRKTTALSLPESLRVAVEYATTEATEVERNLIIMAIVDASRKLRKLQQA